MRSGGKSVSTRQTAKEYSDAHSLLGGELCQGLNSMSF